MRLTGLLAVVVITAGFATVALAQNDAPNRYRTLEDWAKLPDGRTWGATSAVDAARDGSGNIWVAERCGENSCLGKDDVDTVLLFDPSGLYIDGNDILYSADSESNFSANAGWKRGIRIGSATDDMVFAFIPDPEWTGNVRGTTAAEGVAVDADGNIYGAEIGPRALRKHVKR